MKHYQKSTFKKYAIRLSYGRSFYYDNIDEIKQKIESLEKYLDDKKNHFSLLVNYKERGNQLIKERVAILNNRDNYKKGWRYLLKRELKDVFKPTIKSIDNELESGQRIIRDRIFFNQPWFDELINKLIQDSKIEIEGNKRNIEILVSKYETIQERQKREDERRLQKIENNLKILAKQKEKADELRGLANHGIEKSRKLAKTVKRNIESSEHCPYCGEYLFEYHVDHIYPVSKGGLSTESNMVKVCLSCNRKKSNLTLNEFIRKYDYDRDFIENNLDNLKKKY